jgi:hypothetical protein
MVVETKSFHSAEMSRLGKPSKTIRGRVKMEDTSFVFEPYAEASRKLTYQKQVVVGGTTLAVTDDKVKISFMVPRHLTKSLMLMYVQSEMDEVKRRLEEDLYESLVKTPSESSQARRFCEPKGSVSATDAHSASAPSMGSTQSPLN